MKSIRSTMGRAAGLSAALLFTIAVVHAQAPQPARSGEAAASRVASAESAVRPWSGIGRPATRTEIQAWDIDVRPDFKGLPAGKGSVDEGLQVWEAKCESCHGTFGESNEVFTPIVGGTTRADMQSGRVANLKRQDYPQRTTMMKLSQVSTLWDYINRAR
jgi:cytochrome c